VTAGSGVRAWGLAVDFGTTATAAVTVTGRQVSALALDGAGRMSSSVYAAPDGVLLVGERADNSAAYGLDRFEPTPKRRIDRPRVRLGGTSYTPVELISAIMRRVLGDAVAQHDGVAPTSVVLTHPVEWSPGQRGVVGAAAHAAGRELGVVLPDPEFVPEPVAAAQWYARDTHHDPPQPGQRVAVYDLGGGTFDVAVLERTADGYEVLRSGGIDPLGGFDFDHRLFTYLGDKYIGPVDGGLWQALQHPSPGDVEVGERRRRMRNSVQLLKEGLSTETSHSMYMHGVSDMVLVTQDEFNTLIAADVDRTIEELLATLDETGITAGDLAAIYRIGGASRTPLVGRKLEALRAPVRTLDDPKLVVALGASLTATTSAAPAAVPPAPPQPAASARRPPAAAAPQLQAPSAPSPPPPQVSPPTPPQQPAANAWRPPPSKVPLAGGLRMNLTPARQGSAWLRWSRISVVTGTVLFFGAFAAAALGGPAGVFDGILVAAIGLLLIGALIAVVENVVNRGRRRK
jgi:molecular chaperone DnaK (HSP70)